MKLINPIIPGFYPDPSICRVGEDFYLVTSSFEYFPGVPIFHSRDLVHWRQIGHCLTRDSQLPLHHARSSDGIYAPTLRYHNGWFYMITSNMTSGGHFYVKTQDPAGEWSEPVWIEGPWFDPDLFFDDDGRVYFCRMSMGNGIYQREIDLASGKLLGEERTIWHGFEDRFCEAPHIYKINGWYYLLVAEGGTHRSHMIVAARSKSPTGPYEGSPYNPLLTHRTLIGSPIEHTGHGDLVQAPDGSWWIVFLAVRPRNFHTSFFHLGRETFLAPVQWTADGWFVINHRKPIELEMEVPNLPPPHPWQQHPARDDFDQPRLALCWNFRRDPDPESYSLIERPGFLRLKGLAANLGAIEPAAFIGRRQQHFDCIARAKVEFNPTSEDEEAGLTVIMNDDHHYDLFITRREGMRAVILRKQVGDIRVETASQPIGNGAVILEIRASVEKYTFCCGTDPAGMVEVDSGQTRYLSCTVAGTFTGVYLGMFASGNGKPSRAPADFDWFDYSPMNA